MVIPRKWPRTVFLPGTEAAVSHGGKVGVLTQAGWFMVHIVDFCAHCTNPLHQPPLRPQVSCLGSGNCHPPWFPTSLMVCSFFLFPKMAPLPLSTLTGLFVPVICQQPLLSSLWLLSLAFNQISTFNLNLCPELQIHSCV